MEQQTERAAAPHETEETRERILVAAQKLFSEKGFDGASVRDITAEAGCNVASVNYHFGGKDNLYLASFRSLLAALREQRLGLLDELLRRSPTPSLEQFLEGFARGFFDPIAEERRFVALMTWEMFDPRMPRDVFVGEFIEPVMQRAAEALDLFGPPLRRETARLTVISLVGQLLHAVKANRVFSGAGDSRGTSTSIDQAIRHFVRFSAAGIHACSKHDAADERVEEGT